MTTNTQIFLAYAFAVLCCLAAGAIIAFWVLSKTYYKPIDAQISKLKIELDDNLTVIDELEETLDGLKRDLASALKSKAKRSHIYKDMRTARDRQLMTEGAVIVLRLRIQELEREAK